jgi:hypothetical protein
MGRYQGGNESGWHGYAQGGNSQGYKIDQDFVLVDFEVPRVTETGFIDFLPNDNFSQDELLYNQNAQVPDASSPAIGALQAFGSIGKHGQDNQGLSPNYFAADLEVIYFEQGNWGEPLEREDFRFKGLYAAGFDIPEGTVLKDVTLRFIGYRNGDKEFEFTKTVASGSFIKSDYRVKIDRLVITDDSLKNDFVIDNFMAEI